MTGGLTINTSTPQVLPAWELPPLYMRINWAALILPPAGVILFLLAAMYFVPYVQKRLNRGNQSSENFKEGVRTEDNTRRKLSEEIITELTELKLPEIISTSNYWDGGSPERLESEPHHIQVKRTTPSPSPKLGRLQVSPYPPLASQEDLLF